MKYKKDLASLLMFYSQTKKQYSCQQQDEFASTVWEKCQDLKVQNYYKIQRCIEKWDKCFKIIVESETPQICPIEKFDGVVEDAVDVWKEINEKEEVKPFFELGELASTAPGPHKVIGRKKVEAISYFWKFRCFNENAPILSILMLMDDRIENADLDEIIYAFKQIEESRKFEELFAKESYLTEMFRRWRSSMLNRYYREIKEDGKPVNSSHYIRDGQKPNENFMESEFWAAYCFQYMMYCVQHQQSPGTIKIDCTQQWSYFAELWPYDWKIYWPSLFADRKGMTDIWQQDTGINSGKNLLGDAFKKYSKRKREIEETGYYNMERKQENALRREFIARLKERGMGEIADISDERMFVEQWMSPALAALNESGLRKRLMSINKYIKTMQEKEPIYDTIACFRCDALLHALLNGPYKTYYQNALFILAIGRKKGEEDFCRPCFGDDQEERFSMYFINDTFDAKDAKTMLNHMLGIEYSEEDRKTEIENWHKEYIDKLGNKKTGKPWNYEKLCKNIDRDFLKEIFAFTEALPIDDLL